MTKNLNKILIIVFAIFLFFGVTEKTYAASENQIEIDFSKIENPWGLSSKKVINFTEDVKKSNYFHINISKKNELNVWYYDTKMDYNKEENQLEFPSQKVKLQIYLYNNSSGEFYTSNKYEWTWDKIDDGVDGNMNIIYSSYNIKTKTNFPNWTYQYEKIKEIFDTDTYKKEIMEKLIIKLNEKKYKFIITMGTNERFYIKISKNNK